MIESATSAVKSDGQFTFTIDNGKAFAAGYSQGTAYVRKCPTGCIGIK